MNVKTRGTRHAALICLCVPWEKKVRKSYGGRGEIRTHGTLSRTAVFKTAALNHSATLPFETRNNN